MIRNLYIFFYIILLYNLCNINFLIPSSSSTLGLGKKKLKNKKRFSRKKRKAIRFKVNNIVNNIIKNNDNSVETIKQDIIILFTTIAIEYLENNNIEKEKLDWVDKKKIFDKIINIINKNQKIISFNENNDIIKNNNEIVLLKKDIESLSIFKEINKNQLEKYVQSIQEEILKNNSDTELSKDDNGDIIDNKNNVIIGKKDIVAIINKLNNEDQDIVELKEEIFNKFKPYFKKNNYNKDKLINDIDNIFNLSLNFDLILKSIKLTKPFNDGLIDIFIIFYLLDSDKFIIENDNYVYDKIIVFKKFNINNFYSTIVNNVKNYSNHLELLLNADLLNKSNFLNENENLIYSNLKTILKNNISINNILDSIKNNIKNLNFDQKLRYILLYIYTFMLYFNMQENFKSIEDNFKNFIIKYFLENLLENTNIFSDAKKIFNNKIFQTLLQKSNINVEYFFNQNNNSELKLLLFFNIIYNFFNKTINFNIDDNDFKNNLYNNKELENQADKLKKLVEEKKELLINNINSSLYNNQASEEIYKFIQKIKIINKQEMGIFLFNKKKFLENIHIQDSPKNINIPYLILPNSVETKYLNFFGYSSLIDRYKSILDNYYNNNNYPVYFNYNLLFTQDNYKNHLFSILFDRIKTEKKVLAVNSFEIVKVSDFSKNDVINYIDKFNNLTRLSNEDKEIMELIFLILNVLNFDYYFKSLIESLATMKSPHQKMIENFLKTLQNTNKLFLEYLISIFNYIEVVRNNIKNINKTAYEEVFDEFIDTTKNVAAIAGKAGLVLGGTAVAGKMLYEIGAENIARATKEVFGKVVNGGLNMLAKYPKLAVTGGVLGASSLALYARLKNMVAKKKRGEDVNNQVEIQFDQQENLAPIEVRDNLDDQNLN